jgi:hypothetical protein
MTEENYRFWYPFENDSMLSSYLYPLVPKTTTQRIYQERNQDLSEYSDAALALTQVHHIRIST